MQGPFRHPSTWSQSPSWSLAEAVVTNRCWLSSAFSAESAIQLKGSLNRAEKIPVHTMQSDGCALPDIWNPSGGLVTFVLADLRDVCPAASVQPASTLQWVLWLIWEKCSRVPVSDWDQRRYGNTQVWCQLLSSHSLLTRLDLGLLFFSALLDFSVYLVADLNFHFCSLKATSKSFSICASAALEEETCLRGLLFVPLTPHLTNSFKKSWEFMS